MIIFGKILVEISFIPKEEESSNLEILIIGMEFIIKVQKLMLKILVVKT